jgi:DNA-binding MarR family transcriptional regulator
VRDERRGHTLSANQASILDHLDAVQPTYLTDLARHMGVTASTMSLAVDRLEGQGYLVRERDPEDGRRVGLRLTPAGERIKDTDKVLDPELLRGMLRRLAPADLERAIGGLELLAGAARAAMHARSSRHGRGTHTRRPA